MTSERFNELLNGPLSHPFPMMAINRLALALSAVVEATGEAGEKALEEYCRAREQRDETDHEFDLSGHNEDGRYPEDDDA